MTTRSDLPQGACDTHIHVFQRGAPTVSATSLAPPEADVPAYLAMRGALGLDCAVIVQPTAYGTDNSVTAAGIRGLGRDATRGVAVIDAGATDDHIRDLTDAGFCGARLQMLPGGVIPWDQADRVAALAAGAGWHVQLQLDGRSLPDRAAQVLEWPAPVVIDHIGKFLTPVPVEHEAFRCLLRLLDTGRAWVKLSAPYEVSRDGAPAYGDVSALARALVRHAPERMLWASNWPHLGADPAPDNANLLDLLEDWAPDAGTRQRILVDSPAEVYGFAG